MGRAPCCEKEGVKKGPWTPEEDQKLIDYVNQHGPGHWRTLPKKAGLQRCGKSCRLRWTNYLRPDIKRGRFSFEEEETIIQLHSILGNKWSAIATRLPGRTDNEIKNYWNTHIRKRLLRMGIDPVTHTTRLDLLDLSSVLNNNPSLFNNNNNNPSQFNHLSCLLGLQCLVNNPELVRLLFASLSTQTQTQSNPNPVLQKDQLGWPSTGIQSNFNPITQSNQIQTPKQISPSSTPPMTMEPNFDQYPPKINAQNLDPCVTHYSQQNHISNNDQIIQRNGSLNPDELQKFIDALLYDDPNLQSNYINQNNSNSSSTSPNSSSNTEEELDSYWGNIMKFDHMRYGDDHVMDAYSS